MGIGAGAAGAKRPQHEAVVTIDPGPAIPGLENACDEPLRDATCLLFPVSTFLTYLLEVCVCAGLLRPVLNCLKIRENEDEDTQVLATRLRLATEG